MDQELGASSSTSTKWDPSSSSSSAVCALFGGRSLTAHLCELLAGGGQVRPPVDEGPGRPGGREGGEQDPSAGGQLRQRQRHTTRPRTGHRDRPPGPIHAPGPRAARTRHRPNFQDSEHFLISGHLMG